MSTFAFVVGSVLWIAVLAMLWLTVPGSDESPRRDQAAGNASGDSADQSAPDGPAKSVVIRFPARQLPEFEFPECQGGTLTRQSMLGKRWLASFVFTRCVETCPMITRNVADLHKRVAESNPDFWFVTFSVDSSYDTAEVLQKYAETFQADQTRWKFVTGDESQIHDLIRRGFTQYVKPNLGEMRKPGFEVAHSNRAVLVNENGVPVATYLMTDPEDVVRLRRVIEGKTEFPEPAEGSSPGITITGGDDGNPAVQISAVPANSDSSSASPGSEPKQSEPDASQVSVDTASAAETNAITDSRITRNRKIRALLPGWVATLPSINAALNSFCTLLLLWGFVAVRCGRTTLHRNLMISAFAVSVVFLGCYLTYHEALYRWTGERGWAFTGSSQAAMVYWAILIPHVILAAFVPVLAIAVFRYAWRKDWPKHRRLAKITLPVWLFVSITGVVIYWMLYHWPWPQV